MLATGALDVQRRYLSALFHAQDVVSDLGEHVAIAVGQPLFDVLGFCDLGLWCFHHGYVLGQGPCGHCCDLFQYLPEILAALFIGGGRVLYELQHFLIFKLCHAVFIHLSVVHAA